MIKGSVRIKEEEEEAEEGKKKKKHLPNALDRPIAFVC